MAVTGVRLSSVRKVAKDNMEIRINCLLTCCYSTQTGKRTWRQLYSSSPIYLRSLLGIVSFHQLQTEGRVRECENVHGSQL